MSNVKELVAKFEQDQKEIFASLDKTANLLLYGEYADHFG